jgi:hypothetical protein
MITFDMFEWAYDKFIVLAHANDKVIRVVKFQGQKKNKNIMTENSF